MVQELRDFIKLISKEKDLDEKIVAEAIEQAIISASRKDFEQYRKLRPQLDPETGEFKLFVTKRVVEDVKNPKTQMSVNEAEKLINKKSAVGDEIEIEIKPKDFGRIAAQAARQVVYQRLHDAEKDKIYNEYKKRIGEFVTGTVHRIEKNDVIISLGKTDALLPRKETPPGIRYKFGDRLKVVVISVKKSAKGPQVIVSRTTPKLIEQLFIQEVPEISEGIVEIVNIAREPGFRTKIAVRSKNSDVDPVGACVGMKGSRVQMIVRELESEKIDIVPYSDEPSAYIKAALNPAHIIDIKIKEGKKVAEVLVDKENLSLAIGKKGLNARLAVKLTGWKIDIKCEREVLEIAPEVEAEMETETEKEYEREIQMRYLEDFLNQIPDMNNDLFNKIAASQLNSVEILANATLDELKEAFSIEEAYAEAIIQGANEYSEALREMRQEEEKR